MPTGNEFITFEIGQVNLISTAKKYAGIQVIIFGCIKNTKTPFKLDFGVGDVIVPKQEKRSIPTQLSGFESPKLNTYSLETTIAEKLDAILTLMEFSSRMKDYYDIFYIANNFDFDGCILVEALKQTFVNRKHTFTLDNFMWFKRFDNNITAKEMWQAFVDKTKIEIADLRIVLTTICEFLTEPFSAVIEDISFDKKWSATQGKWN